MKQQFLISLISLIISIGWFIYSGFKLHYSILFGLLTSYLPFYFNGYEKKDGFLWPQFQRLKFWKRLSDYHKATINIEKPLNHKQQYIFCCFPHGACTVNHLLTMTDACKMLSDVYTGERRDLAASILFVFPIVREILLFLGCVDASASTAKYNLKKGRSLYIYIGGEKEQLMTTPNESKIYLQTRKGFIKLALTHGAHLVPMYAFGENETYKISKLFMEFRIFLQEKYKLGIPLAWGPSIFPLIPYPVKLGLEIGKPIIVEKKSEDKITDKDIDNLHKIFSNEIKRLFDRTKGKYPGFENSELEIL